MTHVFENTQYTDARSVKKNQTLIPFSFESDGGGTPLLPAFEYPFVEYSSTGTHDVTLTFDWDLPDDFVIFPKATDAVPPVVSAVTANSITVDFTDVAGNERYELLLSLNYDPEVFSGVDFATGGASFEDPLSCCYVATGANQQVASIIGKFTTLGGGLAEYAASRGFYVVDEGGGNYQVHVGVFDPPTCNTIVSSSHGIPNVSYSGDEGFFRISLGSAPVNSEVSFIFSTVL